MLPTDFPSGGRADEQRRLARVLRIIVQIAADPGRWTRADLAVHHHVSERMIQKDLLLIRAAGLRLSRQNAGGYSFAIAPPAVLRPAI